MQGVRSKIRIFAFFTVSMFSMPSLAYVYVVKAGDNLSNVVHVLVPGPVFGKHGNLNKVLKLNPEIQNPDAIFPRDEIDFANLVDEKKTNGSISEKASASPPIRSLTSAAVDNNNTVDSDDGSRTSIELTPSLAMTSITARDLSTGTQDTVASNVYISVDAHYEQNWNEDFKTFLRGKLSYVSFAAPVNNSESLSTHSNFLTTFGLGGSYAFTSRLKVGASFDLEQDLFVSSASSASAAVDPVSIPSLGLNFSYDLIQLSAFILSVGGVYEEKLKANTDAYAIGLGSLYGGVIEVRQKKNGNDLFSVDLGATHRTQNTSVTNQTETTYALSLKLFYPFTRSVADERGNPQ